MTKKKTTSSVMDEHGIQQLNDYEHVRKRLEIYLGSRSVHQQPVFLFGEKDQSIQQLEWVPSILTTIRELIDNSLDEFIRSKHKDPILRVCYNETDMTLSVEDNGRGIPIDYVPETNKNLCTMVLTETKTGRNFDDTDRKAVIGQNGLGGSAAILASSEAEIEIHRTGRPYRNNSDNDAYEGVYKFTQKFKEGTALFPELQMEEPSIRQIKTDKSGTKVKIKISPSVFPNLKLPVELIYSLLKEIAVSNPTYKIYLNDDRIASKGGVEKGLFGVSKALTLHIAEDGFNSSFYVIPNSVSGLPVNLHMQGLVNNAPSLEGGSHLDTFKKNFALGLITALEKESKKRKLKPNRSDIEEGILIYNVTKMDAPSFNSQTKTKLTNEEVIKPINNAMSVEWFADVVKKNRDWIEEIYTRCAERTNKKDAEEDRKAAKKLVKGKVAKLRPATGENRSECTLLLAEGDSAISAILAARNSKIHGVLPLRGKIMNVNGQEKTKELMDSMPLHDIMVSMNLVPGFPLERESLQYGKIYICADEDEDGKNIAALICNFLYKFWPEMFQDPDNPILYVFKTPFIILEKGGDSKYFYGHEVDDYNPDEWKGWKATRAKGLGTLEVNNFQDAMYNGYVVPIIDDGNMGTTLDLIFNKGRADDRKDWMKD